MRFKSEFQNAILKHCCSTSSSISHRPLEHRWVEWVMVTNRNLFGRRRRNKAFDVWKMYLMNRMYCYRQREDVRRTNERMNEKKTIQKILRYKLAELLVSMFSFPIIFHNFFAVILLHFCRVEISNLCSVSFSSLKKRGQRCFGNSIDS